MPRPYDLGRRAALKADTRARIVSAALEIYRDRGLAGASNLAIARAAGVAVTDGVAAKPAEPAGATAEPLVVAQAPGSCSSADLAADVAELSCKRHRPPPLDHPARMSRDRIHHETSRSTMATMRRRVSGSSTDRDLLPCFGRTLIIESNSIQSSVPCSSG